MSAAPPYQLVRTRSRSAGAGAPRLDAEQQAVVDHPGGPLLVLAGPGTGKTTTLVEAVVARIERDGVDPERILVLTFGRKAAAELRQRVVARLDRVTREPLARTFHSYAYGLLRREAALGGNPAPRLLSGPEQDLLIRELLRGDLATGGAAWPATLRPALATRGFAQELRDLLMRAYERGVDPAELRRLGALHGRDDWPAAARFMEQYDQVAALGDAPAYDASELVRAAVGLLAHSTQGVGERERAAYDWVFVDEYQDTDPAQEELLHQLVGRGGNLVVVGDPNQSIYAFRGADIRGIRRFADAFSQASGEPAPQVRLRTSRRAGRELLAATDAIAARMRGPRAHGGMVSAADTLPGRVDIWVAGGASQEAAIVAGVLRRAHLVDGVPWSGMAVLLRSTTRRLGALRRALLAAGVPVAVAAEELPLADQPAVRPLLHVLALAARRTPLDPDDAVTLLTGPLGGMDQLGLRRLRRELRRLELAAGGRRTSLPLLVEALDHPEDLVTFPDRVRVPAERVARVLGAARAAAQSPGATAETVLWAAWSTSGLAGRWQAAAAGGGQREAAADRDLDAVVALFDAAARFTDRLPKAGAEIFLDDVARQQIPADTLAPHAPRGEAVRVLTAHAAKGLEWDLVVVAGVQEGLWPDLRARGSLLGSEQLVELVATGQPVPADQTGRILDEERRLFYVACTRARRQLVVTAVDDSEAGESPSRFLDELPLARDDAAQVVPSRHVELPDPTTLGRLRRRSTVAELVPTLRAVVADPAQPAESRVAAAALDTAATELDRSLDLCSLIAELRSVAAEPAEAPASRRAAGARLAELAAAGVPGADPAEWHGLLPLSDDRPLRGAEEKVRVSPSRVESFRTCQLRWLLESVGGTSGTSMRQSVGTLVHELAALSADPAYRSEQILLARLDERWASLETGGGWFATRQHEQARQMIRRFVAWLAERPDREVLGTEVDFAVDHGRAVLTGRVDRLERDASGRGVVVDVKTGSSKPKAGELAEHPQLGAYQLAVALGAFADAYGVSDPGGASLLQVGKAATKQPEQRQPPLADADDPSWASQLVADAAEGMAGSVFTARENQYCERCPVRTSCPLWDTGRQVVQP